MAIKFRPVGAPSGAPVAGAPVNKELENFQKYGTPTGPMGPEPTPAPPRVTFRPVDQKRTGMTFAGQEMAPENQRPLDPIMDLVTGYNDALAGTLGLAATDVDSIMRTIGMSGFLDMPGDGKKAVQDAMSKLGISSRKETALNDFIADVGVEAFQNSLILAATMGLAPLMAGAQATSVGGSLQKEMGEFMLRHPGVALAGEAGASVGTVGGGRVVSPALEEAGLDPRLAGPVGEIAGAFAGGGLAGGIASLARAGRGKMMQGGGLIAEATGSKPLVSGTPDFDRIGAATNGYKIKVQRAISQALSSIPAGGDPIRAAERLRGGLRAGYRIARTQESELWSRVDMRRPVSTRPLKELAQQMTAQAGAEVRPEFLPGDIIQRIGALPDTIDIKRMRDLRSVVMAHARNMARSTQVVPNDTLRRNLDQLQSGMLDSIATQYPNDLPMAQAREFSTWVHNQFTRGNLSDLARAREMESALPDAQAAVEKFIRSPNAGPSVAGVSETLGAPSIGGRGEDYIRNRFNEIAQNDFGAEGAKKFLDRPEVQRFIKAFPELDGQMASVSTRLGRLLDEQKIVEGSSFFRLADEQPQQAVTRLMGSGTKVKDAATIVSRVGRDPEALKALRDATVTEFGRLYSGNPTRMKDALAAKDMRAMFQRILSPDQFARLQKITNTAAAIEAGGEGGGRKTMRALTRQTASILGASMGRSLGTGTLQAPAKMSQGAQAIIERVFQVVPTDVLLANAVHDPKWEAFLYSRLPENVEDATRVLKQVRGLVSGLSAAQSQILDMSDDK